MDNENNAEKKVIRLIIALPVLMICLFLLIMVFSGIVVYCHNHFGIYNCIFIALLVSAIGTYFILKIITLDDEEEKGVKQYGNNTNQYT